MQTMQTILNYIAIAPVAVAIALFISYCWQRTHNHTTYTQAQVEAAIARLAALPAQQATLSQVPDSKADFSNLLEIPQTPQASEPFPETLPALAKLYGVSGSSKWSLTRKLRPVERTRVLQAIAA